MKQTYIRATATVGVLALLAIVLAACANTVPVSEPRHAELMQAHAAVASNPWLPLAWDGLHDMNGLRDPANPAAKMLQEPRDALAELPLNSAGNMVNWVKALASGAISPRRAKAAPATGVEAEELVMDMDIMLNQNGSMPMVRFPHRAHTMWLACSNCHPAIFVPQKGANRLSMERILMGEQCGICHGAVAFPPTDCTRCHSVPQLSPVIIRSSTDAGAHP